MAEALGIAYVDSEWEHGLRCGDCGRLFAEGDRYSERLDSVIGDAPCVVIVCVGCAIEEVT